MSSTIGHFSLYGDFESDSISKSLCLQPSRVTPKGTLYEGAAVPSKMTEWELYCAEDLTMNQQIEFLLDVLWPSVDAVRNLAQQHHADFNISGSEGEVLELKPEILRKLAELQIHLNCFFAEGGRNAN